MKNYSMIENYITDVFLNLDDRLTTKHGVDTKASIKVGDVDHPVVIRVTPSVVKDECLITFDTDFIRKVDGGTEPYTHTFTWYQPYTDFIDYNQIIKQLQRKIYWFKMASWAKRYLNDIRPNGHHPKSYLYDVENYGNCVYFSQFTSLDIFATKHYDGFSLEPTDFNDFDIKLFEVEMYKIIDAFVFTREDTLWKKLKRKFKKVK